MNEHICQAIMEDGKPCTSNGIRIRAVIGFSDKEAETHTLYMCRPHINMQNQINFKSVN